MQCLRVFAIFAVMVLVLPHYSGLAVEPDEVLSDSKLEKRARKLSAELRCLVCQNQSIDDSNAPLAKDLRVLVRERLKAGDTDNQVIEFIVARYGEFVLLRPRLSLNTLILWLSAPVLMITACLMMYIAYRRRRRDIEDQDQPEGLSKEEQDKLKKLLDEN